MRRISGLLLVALWTLGAARTGLAQTEPASGDAAAEEPAAPAAPTAREEADAQARLAFLKAEVEGAQAEAYAVLLGDVETHLRMFRDREGADEAQLLKATLHQRQGNVAAAIVDLVKLLFEFPQTRLSLQVKKNLVELADKKFSKLKPVIQELSRGAELPDRGDRLALFLEKAMELKEDAYFYDPLLAEFQDFERNLSAHAKGDLLATLLAALHQRKGNFPAALEANRRVLAYFPKSALRVRAQSALADIYAKNLKDFNKAIEAYQAVTEYYGDTAEAQSAYIQIARLLDEEQRQYALAVDIDEKIVKLYPGTEAALKALQHEARLYRERLKSPKEAIASLQRIADGYKGDAAVEALQKAAETSSSDLKDYVQQAEFLQRLAGDYPQHVQAPQALYDAGYAYESYAKDVDKAVAVYQKLSESYPEHKLAKKSQDRIKSLTKTE